MYDLILTFLLLIQRLIMFKTNLLIYQKTVYCYLYFGTLNDSLPKYKKEKFGCYYLKGDNATKI